MTDLDKLEAHPTNDPTNPLHRLGEDLQEGRIKDLAVSADVDYALHEIARLRASARRDAEEIKEARYLLGHVNASTSRAHDPEYIRAGYKYQTHPLSNATYERIKAYFARAAHTGEG